ncbi:MAG: hypothetical protein R3C18_06980 [Planctomycetaceae bacterium]
MSTRRLDIPELFHGTQPRRFTFDGKRSSIQQAAVAAEDLSAARGTWEDEWQSQQELAVAAEAELLQQMGQQLQEIRTRHGESAGKRQLDAWQQELRRFQRQVQQQLSRMKQPSAESLRRNSGLLAGLLKPVTACQRIAQWFVPESRSTWLLTYRQQSEQKRAFRELNDAATQEHQRQVLAAQATLLDRLLGANGQPGTFESLRQPLVETQAKLTGAAQLLDSRCCSSQQLSHAHSCLILVAERLEAVIDPKSGTTVLDLFLELTEQSGCTPANLAAELHRRGIRHHGQRIPVSQWEQFSAIQIAQMVQRLVERIIGVADLQRPLSVDLPEQPIDRIAGITLASPELRHLVEQQIKPLVDRSMPYVKLEVVSGIRLAQRASLYAHKQQFPFWQGQLRSYIRLTDTDDATAYSTDNPWVLTLHQEYYGAPAGAMADVWKWFSKANQAQQRGMTTPHLDRAGIPEHRLLSERVNDRQDSRALFAAAVLAKIVFPLPAQSGRFAMSQFDSRLHQLFADVQFTPRSVSPEFMQGLLSNGRFRDFCQRAFKGGAELRQQFDVLAGEPNADRVSDQLTHLGVITKQGDDCRIAHQLPRMTPDVVPGLYDEQFGPVHGLSEDEFISTLGRNDLLYSVLFCKVLDAYEQGWLSENEIPKSVLTKSRQLQ